MKIYNHIPPYLIRVNIKKQGDETRFITLCETTQEEVYEIIKMLIEKQNISPFAKGHILNIELREAQGSKNGKSISLSFKGLSTAEVYTIIINHVK